MSPTHPRIQATEARLRRDAAWYATLAGALRTAGDEREAAAAGRAERGCWAALASLAVAS